ncbi:MAG: hypothetical protein Q4D79_03220 [Propionibacteriaceae bacterium]|nr:hypothetical protein [Propionibacteriaceae bacterium]
MTGAGTLGIVSGGLGIISGFLTLISTSALSKPIRQARLKAESLQTLAMLGYIQGFGVFLTAVALLASGIMFLNSKGYPVLLYGAFAQAGFTLANSVITLMTPSLLGVDKAANGSTLVGFNVGTALNLIIGLGLAGFTIYLLNTPATKAWRK